MIKKRKLKGNNSKFKGAKPNSGSIFCKFLHLLEVDSPFCIFWTFSIVVSFFKMGKNQAYKAMQRSRLSGAAGPEDVEDGMVDGTFHSPEWHAARLASLNTSHTITWEEFKKKQKEEELKKGEIEADKDRMMRDYRAQLDADRDRKLAAGRNHSGIMLHQKRAKRDKDSKKRNSKKRKHHRRSSDSSSTCSSSDASSPDDDESETRRSRSKSRSKRAKKEKEHKSKSKSKHSCKDGEGSSGPMPLSRFFDDTRS